MKEYFFYYSSSSKTYRVYNNITICLKESMQITFEENQNDKIIEILNYINENI